MSERYPTDAELLSLTEDAATGVEYIATGRSPYHLEFRRMLQRLLLACGRANDLRVYQDGDLSIGARGGRCTIAGQAWMFAGAAQQVVTASQTNYVYLDSSGTLIINTSGFPADRSTFMPLAEVVTTAAAITQITDCRSEAIFASPSAAAIGLTASVDEINQAVDGISANVTALNLNKLCAGPTTPADTLHQHLQVLQDVDGEATFEFINDSDDLAANIAVRWSLPMLMAADAKLLVNTDTGFLRQSYDGEVHDLLGSVHAQCAFEGQITASQSAKLVGVVPVSGQVTDVILSLGTNMQSSNGTDGLTATAKVNDVSLCSTNPALCSSDGTSFRCTNQGDGVAAVVKSDGTQQVQRGDVLTLDLTRTAAGSVSVEAANAVVLIVIRNDRPE
ncbi:MAG: hypothetical protein IT445_12765 [Phycisphaeraceae bacterium]|nr:hypothetical protein [Phycisphaeraceae bacterium]